MALVFHRTLALPLWAVVFFTVALRAAPFLIAVLGIAVIALATPRLVPWLRTRSVVDVLSHRRRHKHAAIAMAAGTCVRALDEPNRSTPEDALDLVRMDADGGQTAPPTAWRRQARGPENVNGPLGAFEPTQPTVSDSHGRRPDGRPPELSVLHMLGVDL